MHILQIMSSQKSICLCIDPKDLNEALEREPYYSRTIDELISMFAGAKVFHHCRYGQRLLASSYCIPSPENLPAWHLT